MPNRRAVSQHRVTRIAGTLLLLVIVFAVIVGASAYRASTRAVTREAQQSNEILSHAVRRLAEELHRATPESPSTRAVLSAWDQLGVAKLGRFLCFIRGDGELGIHTQSPERVGRDFSRQSLATTPSPSAPTIGDLLDAKADWTGEDISSAGEHQVVSFSYSSELGGLIGVHIPAEALAADHGATSRPWLLGLALFTGIALPAAFGLIHFAYRSQLQATERVEADRRALEARLEQAQRLDAIGRLAGGVAHDFNNMLTVILSYAELLRGELTTKSQLESLKGVTDATQRAADLTGQLLAFGRRQILKPELLDVGDVVKQLTPMLKGLTGPAIELKITIARSLAPIRADRAKLEQVMANLVLNARQAIAATGTERGRIAVDVCWEDTQQAEMDDEARPAVPRGDRHIHGSVLVRVADNGEGMDEPTRERIFEPFFTTKAEGQGTGLGMAMVHGTISQSGGSIQVKSAPREGTTISIRLPCVEPQAIETSERPQTTTLEECSGSILLVDDQASLRRVLARALQKAGYDVTEAADGAEGLCRAKERGVECFDLVVADLRMPNMDGIEFVRRLEKESDQELCVLFMTGYSSPESLEGRSEEGGEIIGYPLLHKPFSLDEFLSRVSWSLNQRHSTA